MILYRFFFFTPLILHCFLFFTPLILHCFFFFMQLLCGISVLLCQRCGVVFGGKTRRRILCGVENRIASQLRHAEKLRERWGEVVEAVVEQLDLAEVRERSLSLIHI